MKTAHANKKNEKGKTKKPATLSLDKHSLDKLTSLLNPLTPSVFTQEQEMESVSVSIRLRPLNDRENHANAHVAWDVADNNVTQCDATGRPVASQRYAFGTKQYVVD